MAENNDVIIDVEVNTGGATENINAVEESLENLGEGSNQAEKELADLESAFNRLGLDLKSLEPKLSAFEKRTISTFEAIANNSQATGDQIKAAFEQSLGKIKSPQALKQLEEQFEKLKASGKLTENQLEELSEKLKNFGTQANKTGDDVENLGKKSKEAGEGLSPLDAALENLEGGFDELSDSVPFVGAALNLLKNPATAVGVIFTGLAVELAKVNIEYAKTQRSLTGLLGSQEKANEAMEYARKVANMLGTDLTQTQKTWGSFGVVMKALGLSADEARSFFEQLSYSIVSTGGTIDDVNETIEEFREGLTDGTINGENLEQIFREKLPVAFEATAKAMGMSTDELRNMLDAGIDIKDLLPYIKKGLEDAFGKPKTLEESEAALTRFRNKLSIMFQDVGKDWNIDKKIAGGIDAAGKSITDLTVGLQTIGPMMRLISNEAGIMGEAIKGNLSLDDANQQIVAAQQQYDKSLAAIKGKYEEVGVAKYKSLYDTNPLQERQNVLLAQTKTIVSDLAKDFNALGDESELVSQAIEKVGGTLDFAEPKKAIELITQTIENLRNEAKLTETEIAQGLNKSFDKISDNKLAIMLREVNKELENGKLSVNNYALQTALLNEQQKRTGEGSVAAANATKSLAEAEVATAEAIAQNVLIIGTEQQKLQASLTVKKEQLEVAQKNIALIIEERNALQQKYDADLKEQGGINNLSEGKKKEFEARKLAIDAKNEEIKQSLQVVDGLSREKAELENLTSNYARYIEVLKRSNQDEQFATELQGTYIDLRLRRAQAEQQLAEAMGDSATAAQKQKEADDLTIASASNVVAQQEKKLGGMKLEYEQTINNALGDGILTQAEQDLIQSKSQAVEQQQANIDTARQELQLTEEEISAKQRLAEANKEASAAQAKAKENAAQLAAQGSFVTGIINGWEKSLGSLSEAALKTFQDYGTSQQKVTAGMTEMEIEIKKLDEAERNALRGHGDYGFVKWANDVALRAIEVKKAFYSQAQAADNFAQRLEAMSEGGKGNLQALIREAEGAKSMMNLLDQTRLDALNAAIEGATQRLQQMRDAAQSALDSAERAYLQQKGDQKALLELEYEKQKLELTKQINDAREAGDQKALANLLKAKELNEKTYLLKKKELNENEKTKTSSSNTNTTTTSPDLTKLAESIDKLANKGFGGGNLTINADVSNLMNEQFIRQKILPTFNKVQNNFR